MKPIIFSTENVKALLDGRKTMMRMPIKPQPTHWNDGERIYDKDSIVGPESYNPIRVDKDGEQYPGKEVYGIYSDDGEYGCKAPCQPGDVLYVREAWTRLIDVKGDIEYFYRADMENPTGHYKTAWHPSTHMPLDAARLFLRVTDVRVERVQAIKVDDAGREGFEGFHHKNPMLGNLPEIVWNFKNEWDARNAKRGYGWDSNPWTWVIEFERIEKGAES